MGVRGKGERNREERDNTRDWMGDDGNCDEVAKFG